MWRVMDSPAEMCLQLAPLPLAVRETEAISPWLRAGTAIAYPLKRPRPTRDSKEQAYDLPSCSPLTANVFSFAELLFQINITITLLQKENTKHTPHTVGSNLQIDTTEAVFCSRGVV